MKPTFAALDVARQLTGDQYAEIADAGYKHVGRYYGQNPAKRLTPDEAQAAHDAGVALFMVYEDDPVHRFYFTPSQAAADARRALAQANACGQPAATEIYFAVDYDCSQADLTAILAYFTIVHLALKAAGYLTSVYGNGLICQYLTDVGYAHNGWLSESTGGAGYEDYLTGATWAILQSRETQVCGLDVDIDAIDQAWASGACW